GQWCASHEEAASSPLFARLRLEGVGDASPSGGAAPQGLEEALLAIEPGRRRRARLESHLRERVAQVLRLAPARVDTDRPFRALGLDSLMALALRNLLAADLGLRLSATLGRHHAPLRTLGLDLRN